MKIDMACCGLVCDGCEEYNNGCAGCGNSNGCAAWCKNGGLEMCPIYACCVVENELYDCSVCNSLPCKTFLETKRPSLSEEDHRSQLESRLVLLGAMHHL